MQDSKDHSDSDKCAVFWLKGRDFFWRATLAGSVMVLTVQTLAQAQSNAMGHRMRDDVPIEREISSMAAMPTSATELLQQIKAAIEKELLLDPAFYSDSNLREFCNATEVRWIGKATPQSSGDTALLTALAPQPPEFRLHIEFNPPRRRDAIGRVDERSKLRATVVITGGHYFDIALVERVFGKPASITSLYPSPGAQTAPPERSTPLTTKTNELGNSVITFKFDTSASIGIVSATTKGDGTISRLNVTVSSEAD